MQRALQPHVLAPGQIRIERRFLQRSPNRAAHLGALTDHVEPSHPHPPGRRRQQRGEDQHGRRLARAVGAEKAVDLAGRHTQVDSIDRAHAPLEVADEAFDLDPLSAGAHRLTIAKRDPVAARRRMLSAG